MKNTHLDCITLVRFDIGDIDKRAIRESLSSNPNHT